MKIESNTDSIEWVSDSNFWLPLLFVLLFFTVMLIIVFINTPITFFLFFMLLYILLLIFLLRIPRKVVISVDILIISLVGRTITIRKSDIEKIEAFKLKGIQGQFYYFKIFSKRSLSSRIFREMLPIFIPYDQKPYYNLEPSRIYDIVEEIESWLDIDNSLNIKVS